MNRRAFLKRVLVGATATVALAATKPLAALTAPNPSAVNSWWASQAPIGATTSRALTYDMLADAFKKIGNAPEHPTFIVCSRDTYLRYSRLLATVPLRVAA